MGKVLFLLFRRFLLILTTFLFWDDAGALSNNSIKF